MGIGRFALVGAGNPARDGTGDFLLLMQFAIYISVL